MNLARLQEKLETKITVLEKSPYLPRVLEPGFADRRLYAIYLIQTYHYTRHNSRNQALIATRDEDLNIRYMKFCLRHAADEAGHEMMAFHDLKAMGYPVEIASLPKPLVSTQALIGYLYRISKHAPPLARLGYSYWAERSYEFIRPLLSLMSEGLGISRNAMTFFNEHSEIDSVHAKQVEEAINQFVTTPADWEAVEEVMIGSLILTCRMMDEVFEEFLKLKAGESSTYAFLRV